jgi:hypothetical protein
MMSEMKIHIFEVTAWNNGQYKASGAGYGLKVKREDLQFFENIGPTVSLELEGFREVVIVNIDKPSFWNECREMINKEIGIWLIQNKQTPWIKGKPPKFKVVPLVGNRFRVAKSPL